jgi:excisionase family DNA binding protein
MPSENLLSTTEAAELLKVTPRSVVRMAARGDLPFVRKLPGLTAAYLFDRAVVELYARQQAARSAS